MPVRASIEPLLWENTFFGVNSGIVRIDASAPELTPEALQAWQRVQVKCRLKTSHGCRRCNRWDSLWLKARWILRCR